MSLMRLKPIDNLDDRREIFHQLSKLTVPQRVAFLEWARDTANSRIKIRHNPPWVMVEITSTTGEAAEVYFDLMMMITDFDLPINDVLAELERRAVDARKLWMPTVK